MTEAARLRKEVEVRIQSLQTEIEAGEIKVQNLQKDLQEAERQERGRVVKTPGKGGKLSMLAQLAKDRVEELREALNEIMDQRKMSKDRIAELESILSTFKEEYNPNFNDEGVKRAVRSWEDYAARDKPQIGDDARDRDLVEIAKPDTETGAIDWKSFEEPEESDIDVRKYIPNIPSPTSNLYHELTPKPAVYKFEAYLPTPLRTWLDRKLRDLRIILVENGVLAPTSDSETSSPHLETARSTLKAAEESLQSNRNDLTSHTSDLSAPYGADDVFRALKGQCVSKDSGEYTYELCWLGQTKQKSKKSGGQTVMGNFEGMESVMTDDEVPADGRGVGSGERVALRYGRGQHCWNGPDRSTLVVLACAEVDEVWKVSEEEKCVYRMEVGTPAVCGVAGGSTGGSTGGGGEGRGGKDEL